MADRTLVVDRPAHERPVLPGQAWALPAVGVVAAALALSTHPVEARAAASQGWPPFVLVAGLLLIGLVAQEDGLFAAAGHQLARTSRTGAGLFVGAAAMVTLVTATMNLDTSVAFLTPVLVHTARSRKEPEAPLLVACILLSNAASLFLPGSNLTNLIVVGHGQVGGAEFAARMWAPALAAVVVTALVVAGASRAHLRGTPIHVGRVDPPIVGLGAAAIVAATVTVVALPAPALPVAAIGAVATGVRLAGGRERWARVLEVVGVRVLVGLFGLAVALGTLGRVWSGPADGLASLDARGTAVVGAVCAVALNNLPAASLLAAHPPAHPYALLIGLDLGPNLFVTGSLAWLLWLRAARLVGARPTVSAAVRIGLIAVPLSMAAALAALRLTGAT